MRLSAVVAAKTPSGAKIGGGYLIVWQPHALISTSMFSSVVRGTFLRQGEKSIISSFTYFLFYSLSVQRLRTIGVTPSKVSTHNHAIYNENFNPSSTDVQSMIRC